MNTNPAPSKVYAKVMNLILSKGKLKMHSQVSFGRFLHLCTKNHPYVEYKMCIRPIASEGLKRL